MMTALGLSASGFLFAAAWRRARRPAPPPRPPMVAPQSNVKKVPR